MGQKMWSSPRPSWDGGQCWENSQEFGWGNITKFCKCFQFHHVSSRCFFSVMVTFLHFRETKACRQVTQSRKAAARLGFIGQLEGSHIPTWHGENDREKDEQHDEGVDYVSFNLQGMMMGYPMVDVPWCTWYVRSRSITFDHVRSRSACQGAQGIIDPSHVPTRPAPPPRRLGVKRECCWWRQHFSPSFPELVPSDQHTGPIATKSFQARRPWPLQFFDHGLAGTGLACQTRIGSCILLHFILGNWSKTGRSSIEKAWTDKPRI